MPNLNDPVLNRTNTNSVSVHIKPNNQVRMKSDKWRDMEPYRNNHGNTDMELECCKLSHRISNIALTPDLNYVKSIEPHNKYWVCTKLKSNTKKSSKFIYSKQRKKQKMKHSVINHRHKLLMIPRKDLKQNRNDINSLLNLSIQKNQILNTGINRTNHMHYCFMNKSASCNICLNKAFKNWNELKHHIQSTHISEIPDISI